MKIKGYIKEIYKRVNEFAIYKNARQVKVSEFDFRRNSIKKEDYSPIFFLSTGRTGTEFFTQLLSKSSKFKVFHSPSSLLCNAQSELIEQGRVSYEMYSKFGFDDERTNILASQIFMASREDLLYKTYLHDKTYVETNNRITFLAPAIKYIFPNAKFVHVYRHPGEFIRSGIRRGYYKSESIHETGRLVPLEDSSYYTKWSNFDDIQKVAWLWNETNTFVDDYLMTLDEGDYFKFNFNELNTENIVKLMSFLDVDDINKETIENSINKPTNIQKTGSFPKYNQWKKDDKQKVIDICGHLSLKYGYKL
ncbi:MAG: sulfotransferase [Sulfurovum sp.]|nr:sulfotransferase [Sulfurovum sp.]